MSKINRNSLRKMKARYNNKGELKLNNETVAEVFGFKSALKEVLILKNNQIFNDIIF